MPSFDTRESLLVDVPTGAHYTTTIITNPPTKTGVYWVEVSAVQEGVAWFDDRGLLVPRSTQTISIENLGHWSIEE